MVTVFLFSLLLAAVVFAPRVAALIAAWWHDFTVRRYAEISEPIFERSRDGHDVDVFARAERHRALLLESANQWRPPVYEIIFQEAGFYGESWVDFEARAAAFEREKMNEWLNESKRRDLIGYYTTTLRQRATLN